MGMKMVGVWIATALTGAAIGWYSAMEVERGPAFSGEQDAYERFVNAFTLTDSMERDEVLNRLVHRLTPESLPGAIRAFKESAANVYNDDLRKLTWYWAKQDPRGMLVEMETWTELRARRIAAAEAVYWLLKQEGYDSARALFDALPERQRESALPHLIHAYLESGERTNLIELIDVYNTREERDLAASVVIQHLLRLNRPEDVVQWIESLPEGPGSMNDLKPVAFRAAMNQFMSGEKLDLIDEWLARVEKQQWAKGGRRAAAVNLASRDPMRAIQWVERLTPEQGRDEILSEVVRTFAYNDRAAALEWVRGQQYAPFLDSGMARIAYDYAHVDPSVALEMALRIRDPEVFKNLYKTLTAAWRDLPDEQRKRIVGQLDAHASTLAPSSAAADASGAHG